MSLNVSKVIFAAIAAGVLSLPAIARADALPPEEGACAGKTAGADCDNGGKPGKCTTQKCTRLDYSDGSPPGTKQVDCLLCVSPGATDGGGSDAKAVDATGDAASPTAGGKDAATGSASGGSGDDGGGCSLAAAPMARTAGPWLLAALPLLLTRLASRRKARATKGTARP